MDTYQHEIFKSKGQTADFISECIWQVNYSFKSQSIIIISLFLLYIELVWKFNLIYLFFLIFVMIYLTKKLKLFYLAVTC